MKRIFVFGVFMITVSAMAETVPDTGVMSDNKTYTESCNNATLGTYTGPANMTALYQANPYNCPAGQYLVVGDANTEPQCETCPAGSYCPGTGDVTYTDDMADTGKEMCPSDFANSDVGATSNAQCYTSCVVGDIAHATSVTGNSYADGSNTCSVMSCAAGYGIGDENNLSEILNGQKINNIWETYAWLDENGVYKTSSNTNRMFYNFVDVVAKGQSYYGLNEKNTWAVDLGNKGMIKGRLIYSTKSRITDGDELIDETGMPNAKYAYCQITGYVPLGGNEIQLKVKPAFNATGASKCVSNSTENALVNAKLSVSYCESNTYETACLAGRYLSIENGNIECKPCPVGSYCPGGNKTIDLEKDSVVGVNSCPSGYVNSYSGAATQNRCYRPCDIKNIPYATSVFGNEYYGGTNTCYATKCADGYGLKWNSIESFSELIKKIESDDAWTDNFLYIPYNRNFYGWYQKYDAWGITEENTWAISFGYSNDSNYNYEITDKSVIIKGRGICSTKPGKQEWGRAWTHDEDEYNELAKKVTLYDDLVDETGKNGARYAYCNIYAYRPGDGTEIPVTSSWIYTYDYKDEKTCAESVTDFGCSSIYYMYDGVFALELFKSVKTAPVCVANTIDLKWDGVIDAGDAATCSYSGDLKTPADAPVKKGYTFTGWRVNK